MRLAAFIILVSLFLNFSSPVLAQEISPSSNFYFLRTLWENIQFQFKFSNDQRFSWYYDLAQKKIEDSENLIRQQKYDLVPVILEEYKGQYRFLDETSRESTNLQAQMIDLTSQHIKRLIELYSQTSDLKSKRAIKSSLNHLQKVNVEISKKQNNQKITENLKLTCDFLNNESKNTLWNEVERAIMAVSYEKTCTSRR